MSVHGKVEAAEDWLRIKGYKIMTDTLDYETVVKMLLGAVEQIKENHARLSELDSFGGDGDHGTTMLRAMENLENSVNASQTGQIKKLLSDVGWAVMGTDGGATGPLFGSFFMGMSRGVAEAEALDAGAVAEMLEAGLNYLCKQTKAQIGDKTVIDALAPAVKEARRAADEGLGIATVLKQAAAAAGEGAHSTIDLEPRLGRAKNAAQQSLGHEDPGAVSVSLIFKGFLKGALDDGGQR